MIINFIYHVNVSNRGNKTSVIKQALRPSERELQYIILPVDGNQPAFYGGFQVTSGNPENLQNEM